MKRLILTSAFTLLLAACGAGTPTTLTYSVQFDTENPDRMNDLSLATRHVIERRLERLEGGLFDYDVDYDEETKLATIAVEVDSKESAKALNAEMTAPFDFELRKRTEEDPQDGDIVIEGQGTFRATGITKADVDWVIGETTDPPLNRGRILIGFTDAGVPKVQNLFTEQNGNVVGMFVRNQLMAALTVQAADFERVLLIEGLPSGELAKIFADDMNVGTHMIFTQQ